MNKLTEIIEGNKLIAEFMEFDIAGNIQWYENEDRVLKSTGKHPMIERDGEVEDLQYHSSWDWLMPVVEKIKGLCLEKYSDTDKMGAIFRSIHTVSIVETWQAVVGFIKNDNTKTP